MTEAFVEEPLAMPGSAKYNILHMSYKSAKENVKVFIFC